MVSSLVGTVVASATGRFPVAVILGALAVGLFLRLSGRRAAALEAAPPLPVWVRPMAVLLAGVEAAALVEAVNLPVRFNQAGFQYGHWALLALALLILYAVQMAILSSLIAKLRQRQRR
ncbi:MAG: hypothetical protein RLZZ618_2053 [Pseudomonadota bacterium]